MNMTTKIFLLGLFMTTAFAIGPVGQYLGFRVGKCARDTINEHDSVRYHYPVPSDTIWSHSGIDTSIMLAEFTRGGNPAYLRLYKYHGTDTSLINADTSWEESATFLKTQETFFDTFVVLTPYKIPFAIGSLWPFGMGGTYYVDIDGNGERDTFKIWADTVRIVDQENVRVPYGLVRNAYKLQITVLGYIGMTTGGFPVRDSIYIVTTQWYKDSLWSVKDSLYQNDKMYVYFLNQWYHYADAYRWRVSELTDLWVGIDDESEKSIVQRYKIGPNPFRKELVVYSPSTNEKSQLYIYDASGRLVTQRKLTGNFVWYPNNLPAGVYYFLVKTGNKKRINLGPVIYLK